MKAVLKGRVIAESDDIVEHGGYLYFPNAAVRLELLEKAEKTASDRACPRVSSPAWGASKSATPAPRGATRPRARR